MRPSATSVAALTSLQAASALDAERGKDRSDEKNKKFLSGASALDAERVGTGLIINI